MTLIGGAVVSDGAMTTMRNGEGNNDDDVNENEHNMGETVGVISNLPIFSLLAAPPSGVVGMGSTHRRTTPETQDKNNMRSRYELTI